MTLTRANVEAEIVSRLAGLLTATKLDATTVDGTNASLNSAIGWAVRKVGGTVASIVLVTDSDVATVSAALVDDFLDLAEYRTREVIDGNFAKVDTKVADLDLKFDQLRRANERAMQRLLAVLGSTYGLGSSTILTGGVIELDFQASYPESW